MARHAHAFYLGTILLLALLLAHLFYTGVYWSFDDNYYATFVQQVGSHSFNPVASPYSYGWAFPYFAFLGGALFGFGSHGLVVLTLMEYLSLVLLTYVLGFRVTGSRSMALLSSLLVAIFPFTVQYSTRLIDDMLLGVMATLAMVFLLSGRRRDWMLAGVMAGLLISIKLIGIAFIVPFAACAIASRKRWCVIPMIAIAALAYTIPFLALTHNPLFAFENYGRFQAVFGGSSLGNNVIGLFIYADLVQLTGASAIFYQIYPLGLLLWLALLGSAIAVKFRQRRVTFMAAVFWFFFLYGLFGPTSISHYSFHSFVARYLIMVAAPLAIVVSYGIVKAAEIFPLSRYSGWIPLAIVALMLLLLLLSLVHSYRLVYFYNSVIRLDPYFRFYLS